MSDTSEDGGLCTVVPFWALRQCEAVEAHLTAPPADERADTYPCPVCDKMRDLLASRSGGEFPPAVLQRPRGMRNYSDENADYAAFIADADVRMRYYVQAHLWWFGYYPELCPGTPRPPAEFVVSHSGRTGFPNSPVDGLWGGCSRRAYRAFLADVGPAGRTGWQAEEDVLREEDIRLVRLKCGELFNRPGFNYTTDYRVFLNRSGRSERHRPFLFRRDCLDAPADDPELIEIAEREADYVPLEDLRAWNRPVRADFARSEGLPDDLVWPVRTSRLATPAGDASRSATLGDDELPAELRAQGVTAADLQRIGCHLKKYSPMRWQISYDREGGDRVGRSGRRFNAHRGSAASPRMHAGIDLFADYGDPVVAMTAGTIVGFHTAAPLSTCFLFVYHPDLGCSFNYGEVHHESLMRNGLMVGDTVEAGTVIGAVGRMSTSSMLHIGTYDGRHAAWFGVRTPGRRATGDFVLNNRLNPTKLIRAVRQREYERISG